MKKKGIHKVCQDCIRAHKKHWYLKDGSVWSRDPTGVEDLYICSLIKEDLDLSDEGKGMFTTDELSLANYLFNPVRWSTVELEWNARWYQDQMLNCTARRKVSRIGRRAGKSEAMAIKMLHHAYTNEQIIVLVIAPYKNQVGLIFDKLDMLLAKSEALRSSIKRNTKNPYRVEFYNGSKILGFTSGTRTGSKSTGIRGQDAHMILIDEADYLSESDFEVILAIQASRPDVMIWASSTPTGKRDMFWRFCTDADLGYKEFHFPSSVSPSWTAQTERLERAQYSEQGYAHEFDAKFGDEAEGVFLNKYIDAAVDRYEMDRLRRNPRSLYTFGVDWNTASNGTVIVITEWNKTFNDGAGAFRVVRKHAITQEEFTQVKACEKVIELNKIWNPAVIYVDRGYGATQIEMLRKYGMENPKTGLTNKVKGIYFGDRMEIRDPITKQKIKKHMKPFMVNLAARRLEDGQVILPQSEDVYKAGLVSQMRDYSVVRQTALGQPMYSDNNDHTLVAWMLSILGATMEFSDMVKQNRVVSIGLAGSFGEKQDKDFKVNKKLIYEEKKKVLAVTPRWTNPPLFRDTTLKNTLDHSKSRSRSMEKRSGSKVKRFKKIINRGRSNY